MQIEGTSTSLNVVEGNYIGTDITGMLDRGNTQSGVVVGNGANLNVIGQAVAGGGNLISGNNQYGVMIDGAATNSNVVLGNWIGVDATGNAALANSASGVLIQFAHDNRVGGSSPLARNIISGNAQFGVDITGAGAGNNLIQGNSIGIAADGATDVGNGGTGVIIHEGASANVIGTDIDSSGDATEGNVISGNGWGGIEISGVGTDGNAVRGNLIGTDASGTLDRGNVFGISVFAGPANTIIGGSQPYAGNTIGFNDDVGIFISGDGTNAPHDTTVQGNYIGTDSTGTLNLGNTYSGVYLSTGANSNQIGGIIAGQGNRITNNGTDGVQLTADAGSGNAILRNQISNNGGLGINLMGGIQNIDGVTANDVLDADGGPNLLQNFPVIDDVTTNGGQILLNGSFHSTPSTNYRIEFFASPTPDASGYGEGGRFIAYANVNTLASGDVSLNYIMGTAVAPGEYITATATRTNSSYDVFYETSEFSQAVVATAEIPAGITVSAISGNTTEAGGTATFTVVLDKAPTADVTIALSSNDTSEGTVSAPSLTFTTANWNVAQSVTVTGVDDTWIDGNQSYSILTAAATSSDSAYNGLNASDVSVTNTDLDTVNVITVDTTSDMNDTGLGNSFTLSQLLANMGTDGKISLREAIIAVNNTANGTTPDEIHFDISGAGPHTIDVLSALPSISDSIVIDGWSAPDFAGTPVIELNGTSAGPSTNGLLLSASNSTIRGLVVNRFTNNGIVLNSVSNSVIVGNYLGTDVTGTVDLGNASSGLTVLAGAANQIGGTTLAERNVLSGNNTYGLLLTLNTSGNLVRGNSIGTDATGLLDVGNSLSGIGMQLGAINNLIGGTDTGAGNVIANNTQDGIGTTSGSGTGNAILGNLFRNNGDLAIDIDDNGVTANDLNDTDTGANDRQNFPVISSATLSGTDLTVSGLLDTDGLTTQYRIEFYGNPVGTADATNGEGRVYLGSTTVTTDGSGDATFAGVVINGVTLAAGDTVTATATRIDAPAQVGVNDRLAYGNTSEFAANRLIVAANSAPILDNTGNMTLASINEDAVLNPGNLVSDIIASAGIGRITDSDVGAVEGIAVTGVDNTNGTWMFSTDDITYWSFSFRGVSTAGASDNSAVLLDANSYIKFLANADYSGPSGNITFRAWDTTDGNVSGAFGVTIGATGGTTAYSNATETASVSILAVNDAPVRTAGSVNNLTVLEDSGLTSLGLGGVTYGAGGGTDETTQSLTYTVTTIPSAAFFGQIVLADGTTAVTAGTSYSLGQIQGMQFQTTLNQNGALSFFSYNVQDAGGTANGGVDTLSETIQLSITAVNDAPVAISETYGAVYGLGDGGSLGSNLITVSTGAGVDSDPDGDGIFVTQINGAAFTPGTPLTLGSGAQLTVQTNGGFVYNTYTAFNWLGAGDTTTDSFTYQISDGNGGYDTALVTLTISGTNNTPTITTNKISITEGATVVLSSADINSTDPDNTPAQLTYTASSITGGQFELLASPGSAITSFTQAQINSGAVQFVHNGGESAPSYTLTVNDGIVSGSPVALAVSSFTNVNDAPVLNSGVSPVMNAEAEGSGVPAGAVGTLVSSLVDFATPTGQLDNVTDPDAGALLGIAVIDVDASNGVWWYSTTNGSSWNLLGVASSADARLLAANANTRLYFQPNANYNGTVSNAITFRAWDQTSGVNGGTASTIGGTVLDTFSSTTYAANDGSANWTTDWVETDNDGGGESSGQIRVTGGQLQVQSDSSNDNVYRQVDLSSATLATLSFSYNNTIASGEGDRVLAQVSANGGSSYITLATFSSSNNPGSGTKSFDITGYATSNTLIRFIVTSVDKTVPVYFDDVQISYSTATGGQTAFSDSTATSSMVISAVNDAPTATNLSAAETYTEDTSLNLTDIVISDVDSANVTATLTLSNTAAGSLNTGTSGAVTSTYNAGTGVWAASGAIANVNTLLAGLTFTPTLNFNSNFTITTSVSDGVAAPITGTKTITGTAVNDAPTFTTNTLSITEGGTVVLSTANINSTDSDNTAAQLTYAASSITGGQFELVASPGTAITAFTQAQINGSAVRFVHDGGEAAPNYTLTVSDGSLSDGPNTVSIGVFTNVNDAPAIAFGQGDVSFTEGAGSTPLDTLFTTTDVDSPNFAGGTLAVSLSGGDANDQLMVTHQGTGVGQVLVSGTDLYYNSGAGSVLVANLSGGFGTPLVVTFNGTATAADVQAIARAITFDNSSWNPSTADRTVQFQLTDGDGGTSAAINKLIHVTSVNTAPTVSSPAGITTAVNAPVQFSAANGNAITVGDPDSGANPIQLQLSVTSGTLTLFTTAGLTFTVGDGTVDSSMTLTGTVSAINAALDGLVYSPANGFNGADRLLITINDLGNTADIGGALSDSRGVNLYVGTVPFLQGDYLEVGFNGAGSLGSALNAPAGYQSAGTILGAESDPGRDGGTYDGDFILPGSPEEGWGVGVGGATYSNNTNSYGVDDIVGGFGQVVDTGASQSLNWTGSAGGLQISSDHTVMKAGLSLDITVTLTNTTGATLNDLYYYRNVDPDNNALQSGLYETTNTIVSQGNDGSGISQVTASQADGSFMSLTGLGANSRVTYGGFSNRDPLAIYNGTGGLSQSGSLNSDEAISLAFHIPTLAAGESTTLTLRYTFGNQAAPDIDLDGNNSTAAGVNYQGLFVEDGGPVAIADSDLTLFDADSASLTGVNVTLTNPLDGALESLAANTTGTSITSSYSSGTGVLTLSGSDTLAHYQQVLASVRYNNLSQNPNTTNRVITVSADDGTHNSPLATATISVLATNDAPTLTTNTLSITEGGTVVLGAAQIQSSDIETGPAGLTYTATGITGGRFELVASPGVAITMFTQAQINAGAVQFVHDGGESAPNYSLTVSDGGLSDGPVAVMIGTFTNVNDAPTITTNQLTISEGGSVTLGTANIQSADPDTAPANLTFTATGVSGGAFEFVAVPGTAITSFTQAEVNAGQVRFVHDGGEAAPTYSLTLSDGSANVGPAAGVVAFTNVNDAPTISVNSLSISEGGTVVLGLTDISATDPDNSSAQLTYTASNVSYGQFEYVAVPGTAITTFTQADVNSGLVQFVHDGGDTAPAYDLAVSDGSLSNGPSSVSVAFTAINDAPTISNVANQTVNEDTTLGPLAFTVGDSETAATALVVSATSSDGTRIADANIVLGGSGVNRTVTITPGLNQNGGPVTITLSVSDGVLTTQTTFSVSITPVNDTPVISPAAFSLPENSTNGTTVGTVSASDVDTADTRTFTIIGGDPAGAFAIDAAGVLAVADSLPLDFEATPNWSLTIEVRDAGGLTSTAVVTVSLTDVNDNAPIINSHGGATNASLNVTENTTAVTTITATDADTGTTLVYSLSGDDAGLFQVNSSSGVLTFRAAADYESPQDLDRDNTYEVTVIASDGTYSDSQDLSITVTDLNDNAPLVTAGQTFTVSENSPNGTSVGTVLSTDVDTVGTPQAWTITGGTGATAFAINSVTGEISVQNASLLDFETTPTWTLLVTVFDGAQTSAVQSVTIDLTNVNESPQITGPANSSVDEDATTAALSVTLSDGDTPVSSLVLTASSSDQSLIPDGNIVITGTGANRAVTITPTADLNGGPVTITLTVSDGALSTQTTFEVVVNAVNDVPTISVVPNQTMDEDATTGPLAITVGDIDSSVNSLTVAASSSDQRLIPDGSIVISGTGANRTVTFTPALNQNGGPVTITLTVSDGDLSTQTTFTVDVTPVNDLPVIAPQSFNVNENRPVGTVVGTVVASDVDAGAVLTYAIDAGNTNGAFSIDAASGQITVANPAALDFETTPQYQLTVSVTDSIGTPQTATITINLNDINEAPTSLALSNNSVNENSSVGTLVGSLLSTDVDAGDSATYSLVDDAGGLFAVDANTGEITVKGALDFETSANHTITARITDNGGLVLDRSFVISLVDINEAPVLVGAAFGLPENSSLGTLVGTLSASDVDAGDQLTFSLISGNTGGAFSIDGNTGAITVANTAAVDFETNGSFTLTAQVADRAGQGLRI